MKSIVLSLCLLSLGHLTSPLQAAEESSAKDAFLQEIRALARDGKLSTAKERVRSQVATGGALDRVKGHLYLAYLELLDGFDTNAAAASAIEMLTVAKALPRGTDQVVAAMLLDKAGILMTYAGRYPEAEGCLQWSYDVIAKKAGPYSPITSYVQGRLGSVQLARGDLKPAAANLKDAATNLQLTHVRVAAPAGYGVYRMSASGALATQGFLSDYANLLRREEKFRYEGNRLKEYLRFADRSFGKATAENVPILLRLGYNYESRKSRSSARKYFQEAVKLAEQHRSTHAGLYWQALTHAHEYFRRSGQTKEQAEMASLMMQDPSPSAEPAEEAKSLRTYLHASIGERLQEKFRQDPEMRQQFIREDFYGK